VYNGCFNLFEDNRISKTKFALIFAGKAIAVPVFIFVYNQFYGGIKNFDTGKFYHDVMVISDLAKKDLNFFLRFILGFQNDQLGSYDYEYAFRSTYNWSNGKIKDYVYNDNRILIRVHVLINFIAFNSYPVHALLNCFLSFIGIYFLFKTFKEWFVGKELLMLLILCFFPALWFYTGALLKEGISIFVLGNLAYQVKKVCFHKTLLLSKLYLVFLLLISVLLKPYVLAFSGVCFTLFFMLVRSSKIKNKVIVFISVLFFFVFLVNIFSILLKNRSIGTAIMQHQQRFISVSKGGIFLENALTFARLPNDTALIKKVPGTKNIFTINSKVSFIYWKTGKKDTLYCLDNSDTVSRYELVEIIHESHSNISTSQTNLLSVIASCYYYTLFYPFFFNAANALQFLASFENLAIVAALIMIIFGMFQNRKNSLLPVAFMCIALCICLLVGFSAPNSGAIFRYRSPAIIFMLLAALYYCKQLFKKRKPE